MVERADVLLLEGADLLVQLVALLLGDLLSGNLGPSSGHLALSWCLGLSASTRRPWTVSGWSRVISGDLGPSASTQRCRGRCGQSARGGRRSVPWRGPSGGGDSRVSCESAVRWTAPHAHRSGARLRGGNPRHDQERQEPHAAFQVEGLVPVRVEKTRRWSRVVSGDLG